MKEFDERNVCTLGERDKPSVLFEIINGRRYRAADARLPTTFYNRFQLTMTTQEKRFKVNARCFLISSIARNSFGWFKSKTLIILRRLL